MGTAISTTIKDNIIKSVGYHWLSMRDWTNITIHNNTFGEFSAISVSKTTNPGVCVFSRNFITTLPPGGLNFNHSSCKFKEISFFNLCNCNFDWLKKLGPIDISSESFCRVDDTLKHCFNSTIFNIRRYIDQVCDTKSKHLDCMKNMNVNRIEGKFIPPEEIRKTTTKYIMIAAISIVILLTVIISLVVYFACKKYCSNKDDPEMYLLNGRVKRPKIFSDHDLDIITNTLGTMKLNESHAVYSHIYQNTKKLMDGKLDEPEMVDCIGAIVRTLNEGRTPCQEYVAFTNILYRLLRPAESAPTEQELEDQTTLNTDNITIPRGNHEHIYAEPQLCGSQKPLLNHDYSLPMDRDNETLPLYSEPIRKVKSPEPLPRMATPYAIGNATNVVQLSPAETMLVSANTNVEYPNSSTSKPNLPDILYQSVNTNFKRNNKNQNNNNQSSTSSSSGILQTEVSPQIV